jgi:hypothetical protein
VAFTIPSRDVAGNASQAEIHATDIRALTDGLNGVGVVSGCAVTAQGSPDMTVAIAAGTIRIASGALVTVTSGNGTITTADATNPRIDVISASNAGVKTVTAGTPAAAPKPPDLPAGNVALAFVYVAAGDTAISSGEITDKRVILAAGGTSLPTGYEGTILGDKPIFYLPLQEAAGPIAFDLSKYPLAGHNARMNGNGSATWNVGSGPVATYPKSVTFDGTNAWLSAGQYLWDQLWATSIEVWVKTTSTGRQFIKHKRGTTAVNLAFGSTGGGFGGDGKPRIFVDASATDYGVHYNTAINDGNWHHVVATWEADNGVSVATGQFAIYVDGSAVTTTTGTLGSPVSPMQEDNYLSIGSAQGSNKWNGSLCHFAIYDYVLSSAQVAAHYAARL